MTEKRYGCDKSVRSVKLSKQSRAQGRPMEYRNAEFRRGEEIMHLNRLVRRGGYVHKVHSGHLQSLHTPAARVIPPPPTPALSLTWGPEQSPHCAAWRQQCGDCCHCAAAIPVPPPVWTPEAGRSALAAHSDGNRASRAQLR